jgi:hypothetical protein
MAKIVQLVHVILQLVANVCFSLSLGAQCVQFVIFVENPWRVPCLN